MNISYSFRTHDFSTSIFSGAFAVFQAVAGFVARWHDYAVTPVSQFFTF
jgi:hypothetical protein